MGSCVPQKDTIYLQNVDNLNDKVVVFSNEKDKNIIQPFDQVYIQVSSFDDGNLNFMENNPNRFGGGRSEFDLAMVSYSVDAKGNVKLPILGFTKVSGLTTDQASEKIRKELESYLNTPSVKVQFINKSVTVLGSVNRPGRFFYASQYLTIFQALGMAGDISEYGNRKQAVLVRSIDNEVTYQKINLTDIKLLSKKELYLQPNDLIYIAPLKRRHWGFREFPWSIILSSITTLILVANYINK